MAYLLLFIYPGDVVPKQALPVADLKTIHIEGSNIGGRAQSICWSPNGNYVAIMFRDTSSIAIFATAINRHSLSISPAFFIGGSNLMEYPTFICFQAKYPNKHETILTIAWSSGRIQYFPFIWWSRLIKIFPKCNSQLKHKNIPLRLFKFCVSYVNHCNGQQNPLGTQIQLAEELICFNFYNVLALKFV